MRGNLIYKTLGSNILNFQIFNKIIFKKTPENEPTFSLRYFEWFLLNFAKKS